MRGKAVFFSAPQGEKERERERVGKMEMERRGELGRDAGEVPLH